MYRINFKCEIEILTYNDKRILNNINPDYSKIPDKELTLDARKVYDIIGTFEALDEFKNPNAAK